MAVKVKFAGQKFVHSEQVELTGREGALQGAFVVPERIGAQLEARRRAWPIPWTTQDYETTWLAPGRLLLFLQFAEPKDAQAPTIKVDGQPLSLKRAYSSVRVHSASFVGFYADLSGIKPDTEHELEVKLPEPGTGQFQGAFFDNVQPEYTEVIVPSL